MGEWRKRGDRRERENEESGRTVGAEERREQENGESGRMEIVRRTGRAKRMGREGKRRKRENGESKGTGEIESEGPEGAGERENGQSGRTVGAGEPVNGESG